MKEKIINAVINAVLCALATGWVGCFVGIFIATSAVESFAISSKEYTAISIMLFLGLFLCGLGMACLLKALGLSIVCDDFADDDDDVIKISRTEEVKTDGLEDEYDFNSFM